MGGDGHTEVERSFCAAADTVLPDLRVGPVDRVRPGAAAELTATYHDTADLDLARCGVTVRRRVGGSDEGWHVKVRSLDDPHERLELHRPVGRSARMPVAISRLLLGAARHRDLVAVVEVATRRQQHDLLSADKTVLAVVADDRVTSRLLTDVAEPEAVLRWREVEVELGAGDTDLLDRLATVLHDAGLPDAPEQSKLRRALGPRLAAATPAPATAGAAAVLGAHLERLRVALVVRDLHVRAERGDGVHQLRIAARRLRSVLAAYRPLLDDGRARRLERELRWLGRELAAARDLEVMGQQLQALLRDEQHHERGPRGTAAARHVRATLDAERDEADSRVWETLGSTRYLRLLDAVARLAAQPPWTERAGDPAGRTVRRRARKAHRRLGSRMAAVEPLDGHERDLALHAARKAAKRARYALEVAEPVVGKRARRLRLRTKRLQQVLGSHQDTVVLRARLRSLVEATDDPGVAFTYGRLHARLQRRAERLDRLALARWRQAASAKAAGWLG